MAENPLLIRRIANLRILICIFAILSCLKSSAADVLFNLGDFTARPELIRTFQLYPVAIPSTNSSQIVMLDRYATNSGTGSFVISNVIWGAYRSELTGNRMTTTNYFNFPDTNGLIDARFYLSPPTNLVAPGSLFAYSQAQADARFVHIAGDIMTGPLSLPGKTNTSLAISSIELTDTNKAEVSLVNGGAGTFLEGTTPPNFRTINFTDLNYPSVNANLIFAGPANSGPATASFRSLVGNDFNPGIIQLGSLAQSSASTYQFPIWNGAGWVPKGFSSKFDPTGTSVDLTNVPSSIVVGNGLGSAQQADWYFWGDGSNYWAQSRGGTATSSSDFGALLQNAIDTSPSVGELSFHVASSSKAGGALQIYFITNTVIVKQTLRLSGEGKSQTLIAPGTTNAYALFQLGDGTHAFESGRFENILFHGSAPPCTNATAIDSVNCLEVQAYQCVFDGFQRCVIDETSGTGDNFSQFQNCIFDQAVGPASTSILFAHKTLALQSADCLIQSCYFYSQGDMIVCSNDFQNLQIHDCRFLGSSPGSAYGVRIEGGSQFSIIGNNFNDFTSVTPILIRGRSSSTNLSGVIGFNIAGFSDTNLIAAIGANVSGVSLIGNTVSGTNSTSADAASFTTLEAGGSSIASSNTFQVDAPHMAKAVQVDTNGNVFIGSQVSGNYYGAGTNLLMWYPANTWDLDASYTRLTVASRTPLYFIGDGVAYPGSANASIYINIPEWVTNIQGTMYFIATNTMSWTNEFDLFYACMSDPTVGSGGRIQLAASPQVAVNATNGMNPVSFNVATTGYATNALKWIRLLSYPSTNSSTRFMVGPQRFQFN